LLFGEALFFILFFPVWARMPRRFSSERSVFAEMTLRFCASPMIFASSVLPVSAVKSVDTFAVTVSAILSHCATYASPSSSPFF
jgi:hypothetical protein